MSNYNNLPTIIGQMKRAAIDMLMAESSWVPDGGDDSTRYRVWGWLPGSYYTRPDAGGSGGGRPWTAVIPMQSRVSEFDSVRYTIDGYTAKWLDLPDGQNCTSLATGARNAAGTFRVSGPGASFKSGDELETAQLTIETYLAKIEGSFKPMFHEKYYVQLSKVTTGLGTACAILQMNYAAQAIIWPSAREDAAAICANARDVFNEQARTSAAASQKFVLTVIGLVAAGVATIATAGIATGPVVALVGLSTAASAVMGNIEANTAIRGHSFDQLVGSLGESLGVLNTAIATQERELNDMLLKAATAIEESLPDFNLDAFPWPSQLATSEQLSMHTGDTVMVSKSMTTIDGEIISAGSSLGNEPGSNPTPRNALLGAGTNGTYPNARELHRLTARCLRLTQLEYERGQMLFDATVVDYFRADAESAATVKRLAESEALATPMEVLMGPRKTVNLTVGGTHAD